MPMEGRVLPRGQADAVASPRCAKLSRGRNIRWLRRDWSMNQVTPCIIWRLVLVGKRYIFGFPRVRFCVLNNRQGV